MIAKSPDGFVIEQIPRWLARYLEVQDNPEAGRQAFDAVAAGIPEFYEMISQVWSSQEAVSGFLATISDHQNRKHTISLDARHHTQTSGNQAISVSIKEITPHAKLVADDQEKKEFFGMVGRSEAINRVFNKVKMYSAVDAPVLVTGETGSGKEGVAAALHKAGRRSVGPFVTLNCSAVTETLFESELFGHEKGSFTGAIRSHRGRFERAHRGSLFLDEIGEMPLAMQAKLLRVIENETVDRVGSEDPLKVDVRIIAATNRDLEVESLNRTFRSDLFYRISALQIRIPSLRERSEDLELLIEHFIVILNRKYNRSVVGLTNDAIALLKEYQWPGNVRELRNLLERLFAETQSDVIGLKALREWYEERKSFLNNVQASNPNVTILPYKPAIQLGMDERENGLASAVNITSRPGLSAIGSVKPEISAELIREAFGKAGGNITQAARLLGIHKATLYRHMKNLNLDRSELERSL